MLERTHAWPEGHWDWLIHLSHKHGLRCGRMIFVGGQVDKDPQGKMLNAYDFATQTRVVIDHIARVLEEFDAGLGDVVSLVAFYVNDGSVDEADFLRAIGARFDDARGPAITLVPLPWLAYPGMMVEIEAIAMLGEAGAQLSGLSAVRAGSGLEAPGLSSVRWVDEMIFVGAQSARGASPSPLPADMAGQCDAAMGHLATLLGELGADLEDAVRLNLYYLADRTGDNWRAALAACGRHFAAPGPAITALPLPWLPDGELLRIGLTAMRGADGQPLARRNVSPEGHADWPLALPFSQGLLCGQMVFVGGQESLDPNGAVIDPGDMVPQTRRAMDNLAAVLAGFGLVLDDSVKINAFYKGQAGPDNIVENQRIRSGCFREPGPASTGVPLPGLAAEDSMISVEAVAMLR